MTLHSFRKLIYLCFDAVSITFLDTTWCFFIMHYFHWVTYCKIICRKNKTWSHWNL